MSNRRNVYNRGDINKLDIMRKMREQEMRDLQRIEQEAAMQRKQEAAMQRKQREQEAMQREQEAMQRKQKDEEIQKAVRESVTFNIGLSDEPERVRNYINSVRRPLRIFEVPDDAPPPVMSAPPSTSAPPIRIYPDDRFNNPLFDSRYPGIKFSSTTHFPGAPVNPTILENAKMIDELNKSKMEMGGARKKKKYTQTRQKKQQRRRRHRRHLTRKYKK